MSVIEAIAEAGDAELIVIGYETIGSRNYTSEIVRQAERLGIADRVSMLGAIPRRRDMLEITSRCHVGLSLMPMDTTDPNEANMAGASNKAFDYMARGLGLIVSDLPSWRTMFVEPGFALACDPREPASVVRALRWYATHREDAPRRGLAAQQRIRDSWNYETQFAPVARAILGSDARASHAVSVVA
jgi:glycosyltransferase involved in cell wall biosynthesis